MSWNQTRPRGQSYKKAVVTHVDKKHTVADTAQGSAGMDDPYPRVANHHESVMAQHGFHWAAPHGKTAIPFNPSNGMHSTGKDHAHCFASSVNMSGGVRQGSRFVSDPASGIARPAIKENKLHLDMQTQGSSRTFRSQRGY